MDRRVVRRVMCALFVLCACAVAPPPPVPVPDEHAFASVPIRCELNQVRLPISVAGSPPFNVLLDTGMPSRGLVLYESDRVDALGLALVDGPGIFGAGGTGAMARTRVAKDVTLFIGGQLLTGVLVIVTPSPPGFGSTEDGAIGAELFRRCAVRIDVDDKKLDLLDFASVAPPPHGIEVPIHFRWGAPFVNARVGVGEGELLPAELLIDLGAGHALFLLSDREERFGPPSRSIERGLGSGFSGSIEGHVGRVRCLQLETVVLRDLVGVFPQSHQLKIGGLDLADGLIGGEVLSRFRVTFDYAGQRMILVPGRTFSDPFEHEMCGLNLDLAADRCVVQEVVVPSPASDAGILTGDVLLAVDGRSIRELGPDALRRALRAEGAEVGLTLQRGAETIEKRVRLRRLI